MAKDKTTVQHKASLATWSSQLGDAGRKKVKLTPELVENVGRFLEPSYKRNKRTAKILAEVFDYLSANNAPEELINAVFGCTAASLEQDMKTVKEWLDSRPPIPAVIRQSFDAVMEGSKVGMPEITGKVLAILEEAEKAKKAEDRKVPGFEFYRQLHLGQPSMKAQIRVLLQRMSPENRVWVGYDAKADTYWIISRGVEMPDGWEGYIPEDLREDGDGEETNGDDNGENGDGNGQNDDGAQTGAENGD